MLKMINKTGRLHKGDTIGIVCPSHIGNKERYDRDAETLINLGFRVKFGANMYRDTYGYLASEQERAEDFNAMIADPEVRMLMFGGGEGACEILPLIDYDNIKRNPKLICSFSDGTTILCAIHAMTGLNVYYGQSPGMFYDLRHYDYRHFAENFLHGETRNPEFIKDSKWQTCSGGIGEGKLIGGYTKNFVIMLGSQYFNYNKNEKYLIFLEDYEKFSTLACVSAYISYIEQQDFIRNAAGLIFGHYSKNTPLDLLHRLERFGASHNIPVVYCDDFGHGNRHAIFEIGVRARLDADRQKLIFLE